jgi:hypothetical protein
MQSRCDRPKRLTLSGKQQRFDGGAGMRGLLRMDAPTHLYSILSGSCRGSNFLSSLLLGHSSLL